MMFDLLVTADIHLTNNFPMGNIDKFGVNSFLGLVKDMLFEMIDDAAKKNCIMVVCGDTFDCANADPVVARVFHQVLVHAYALHVEILFITGNHEFDGLRSIIDSYDILSKINMPNFHFIFKPSIFNIKDINFYCVPYIGKSIELQTQAVTTFIKRAKEDTTKKKVLLFHYPVVGCRFNNASIKLTSGFDLKEILSKNGNPFSYILAGDFHERQGLDGINNFLYVGQPYQEDFGSVGRVGGYSLIDLTNKKAELIKTNKCPEFLVFDDITDVSSLNSDLKNKVVRFNVEQNIDRTALMDKAYNLGAYKVQVRTKRKGRQRIAGQKSISFTTDHQTLIADFAKLLCPKDCDLEKFTELGLALYAEAGK